MLRVEALEDYVLLSAFNPLYTLVTGTPASSIAPVSPAISAQAVQATSQTITQSLSVPSNLTNFSLPLTPNLQLFNPALGTLVSVTVSGTASVTSMIETQNTSPNSSATNVQANVTGNFTLPLADPNHSLTGSFSKSTPPNVLTLTEFQPPFIINFQPPSGHMFPALTASGNLGGAGGQPVVITDLADLAFYTASTGHTQKTLTLTANAQSGATGTNGNLVTNTTTTGQASVTVTYTYVPVVVPPPVITTVSLNGIHHEQSHVFVVFDSALNPQAATDVNNYMIRAANGHGSFNGPGSRQIAILSATYDPETNQVTLTPAEHLNFHFFYQLTVQIQNISVGGNGSPVTTTFGGVNDLNPPLSVELYQAHHHHTWKTTTAQAQPRGSLTLSMVKGRFH